MIDIPLKEPTIFLTLRNLIFFSYLNSKFKNEIHKYQFYNNIHLFIVPTNTIYTYLSHTKSESSDQYKCHAYRLYESDGIQHGFE